MSEFIPEFQVQLKRTKPPKNKIAAAMVENPLLALRVLNDRSFYRFLKYMWDELSDEKLQENWHLKYICDRLQVIAEQVADQRSKTYKDQLDDLIANVPPGSSKTTIMSIAFPAWCWTRWYWMQFICLSYSATLALEAAEKCRDLVRSDKYTAMYPDLSIKADKDQKSNFTILKQFDGKPGVKPSIKSGGKRFSTSVGGSLTGFHGHFILVDDPINPEQAVSPVQLEGANRWLTQTMPTRKIHKGASPTIYIMQRLHEDDPTGHKLKKKKTNVQHICLPGEIRDYADQVQPPELTEFYSEDGLLDPVRMSWDVLDDLKADLGQYGYAGQIGQSPTPPTGGMFKVDMISVVDSIPPANEIEGIVRYWDKAGTEVKAGSSKKKGPAFTVGFKMAKLTNGKYLILDIARGRWSSEKRESVIKSRTEADGTKVRVGIEQEPGSGGKESAEATVKNLAGYSVRVDRPTGDKVFRADPFSVQVNYGNVLMLRADWNKDLLDEMKFFPLSSFKDQVDAGSGAFSMLARKKKARVW